MKVSGPDAGLKARSTRTVCLNDSSIRRPEGPLYPDGLNDSIIRCRPEGQFYPDGSESPFLKLITNPALR
jgi:hypothetical protein